MRNKKNIKIILKINNNYSIGESEGYFLIKLKEKNI
jgi:hypothetical protein